MEYLREGTVEKEEEKETATSRIGIITLKEKSDQTKTKNKGWSQKKRKISWVDRIKTIGIITML